MLHWRRASHPVCVDIVLLVKERQERADRGREKENRIGCSQNLDGFMCVYVYVYVYVWSIYCDKLSFIINGIH